MFEKVCFLNFVLKFGQDTHTTQSLKTKSDCASLGVKSAAFSVVVALHCKLIHLYTNAHVFSAFSCQCRVVKGPRFSLRGLCSLAVESKIKLSVSNVTSAHTVKQGELRPGVGLYPSPSQQREGTEEVVSNGSCCPEKLQSNGLQISQLNCSLLLKQREALFFSSRNSEALLSSPEL